MSVGQALANAREERGLSIDEISAATRIRGTLIRDIERDDFHGCGGDVYARGHIRSIARIVGVDPEPLIAEFDAAHHSVEPPVVPAAPAETDQFALAHTERRRPNWTAAMVAALLVIIAIAAYGLVSHGSGKGNHHGSGIKANGTSPQPSTSTTPTSPASPPPHTIAYLNPNKAVLLIRAHSTSWVEVTDVETGQILYENDMVSGQSKHFVKKAPLSFVIGNAPGVDMVINGKDIGSPKSPSGDVVVRGTIKPGASRFTPA